MRALRVVGYDEEGSGQPRVILEDPERRERFSVPADERLRAAARGDVQRLGEMIASSSEAESQLRPREIQARIRAGASVEQVAEAAGVPHARIERFAYPVLLERSRFAELARAAHPIRRDGPDVRTLGEVVSHTFELRGQEYEQAAWDAWRGEDNKWVVTLSWKVGRSDITARWRYQSGSHGGTVTALDEHATDLIDGQLARPPRRVGPVVDFSKPDAETAEEPAPPSTDLGRRATKTTTGRGATGGRTPSPATQPTLEEAAADPARPAAAAGSRSSAAAGRPSAAAGRSRAAGAGRRAASTTGAGRATTGRPVDPEPRTSAPPGPDAVQPAEASAAQEPGPPTKRAARKTKPVMPSWEDVLLGVKSQRN